MPRSGELELNAHPVSSSTHLSQRALLVADTHRASPASLFAWNGLGEAQSESLNDYSDHQRPDYEALHTIRWDEDVRGGTRHGHNYLSLPKTGGDHARVLHLRSYHGGRACQRRAASIALAAARCRTCGDGVRHFSSPAIALRIFKVPGGTPGDRLRGLGARISTRNSLRARPAAVAALQRAFDTR